MPNNDNLLSKARKRIIQGLSAIMTVAMLTSCQPKVPDKTDDPTHETGGNGGQTNNGGTTNGGSTSNGGTTENKYKDYSELFQYFMTECNGERYFGDRDYMGKYTSVPNKNMTNSDNNNCIPFSFLSSAGYSDEDIAKMKNREMYADCTTAIMDNEPNSLYMFVRVVVDDIYDMYTLKYEMSDKEISEYKKIYPSSQFTNAGLVYNDVISAFKEETIVGHYKIAKDVLDLMAENDLTSKRLIVYGFNPETRYANIYMYETDRGYNDAIFDRDIYFSSSKILNFTYINGVIRSKAEYGNGGVSFKNIRPKIPASIFNHSSDDQYYSTNVDLNFK